MLEQALQAQRDIGPGLERLATLELARHQFEARIEGKLLQADGKLKAARNAEARERQIKRSYENHLLDPSDSDGERAEEALPPNHAQAGEEEGLRPLRLDVAPSNKAAAVRAKFGI